MMNTQNNPLAIQKNFIIPAIETEESGFAPDELDEDMDGLQLRFPRVKIPSGGALQFELPTGDPTNPDYSKTLEGVILFNHSSYAYWPEGDEYDDDTAPLCSSADGKTGIGEPGGLCVQCALNRFGSGPKGRGKACKNMRVLYLLRSGEVMPLQVTLPPTSLSPFSEFMSHAFRFRKRSTTGSVVQIGLKRANNGEQDYSVATFRLLYDLEGEDWAKMHTFASVFREQAKMMQEQRAALTESQRDTGCDYDNVETLPVGNGQHFDIRGTIDGDREALPA